jgi:hypothetical protein
MTKRLFPTYVKNARVGVVVRFGNCRSSAAKARTESQAFIAAVNRCATQKKRKIDFFRKL